MTSKQPQIRKAEDWNADFDKQSKRRYEPRDLREIEYDARMGRRSAISLASITDVIHLASRTCTLLVGGNELYYHLGTLHSSSSSHSAHTVLAKLQEQRLITQNGLGGSFGRKKSKAGVPLSKFWLLSNLRSFRHVAPFGSSIPDSSPSPSYFEEDIPRRPRPSERGGSHASNASSRISVAAFRVAVAKRQREREMGRMSPSFGTGGGAGSTVSSVSSATANGPSQMHIPASEFPSSSTPAYSSSSPSPYSHRPPYPHPAPLPHQQHHVPAATTFTDVTSPPLTTPPMIRTRRTPHSRRSSRLDGLGAETAD
ncbi:hypothetical protein R3P38DRAFT_3235395 [Favolaschia claudopus]|uniref:Uncharacterized protein n=1 Tax=Favolaschia claudopus TaxID=2862362 RepID=A0AAV9ZEN5_9AGAR